MVYVENVWQVCVYICVYLYKRERVVDVLGRKEGRGSEEEKNEARGNVAVGEQEDR